MSNNSFIMSDKQANIKEGERWVEEEDTCWQEIIEERWVELMHQACLCWEAEGPTGVYVDEKANIEEGEQSGVEEEDAHWQEIIDKKWAEMTHQAHLCWEAEGPMDLYVDASMEEFAVFRPDGEAIVFEAEDIMFEPLE
jgi:hypothetical protein